MYHPSGHPVNQEIGLGAIFIPIFKEDTIMAKAKYKKNARGEFETKIWDGTYNPDGSKHRKRLVSKKSSADLERQVSQLKNSV